MFRFFRKHRSVVMVFMAACIGGLILFGVGGSSFVSTSHDTIFKVNGVKVPQAQYDRTYNQLVRQREAANLPTDQRNQLQSQALNEVIRQEVFAQEAQKYGIEITDQELQMQLMSIPAFQKDGHFDPATYVRVVAQTFSMAPRDFEKEHKKDMAGRQLNSLIATAVNISDEQLTASMDAAVKAEMDPKKRKELQADPEKIRQQIWEKEANFVFGDWLNQLNSTLKVNIVSDAFRKRLGGQPAK